jgi:cysteine desulfurase
MAKRVAYLDNNATTEQCKPSIEAMAAWAKVPANASTTSEAGREARKMIEDARRSILTHCGAAAGYTCVFTSGASESNSFIIRSTVEAYLKVKKVKPHVLTSLTEHKSVRDTCAILERGGYCDVTYVAPGISGCIPSKLIEAGIKPNTCLVTIMSANNELGCVNDLAKMAAIAHARHVPFHSDCVQTFGKYKYNLPKLGIDAISASFHKLYGPKGCGVLIVNNDLISGYGLEAQIAGSQEFGLRGGTENIQAIAGAIAAFKHTWTRRATKNAHMAKLRGYLIDSLSAKFDIGDYKDYVGIASTGANALASLVPAGHDAGVKLVFLSATGPETDPPRTLPNTLLVSIAKPEGTPFCNGKLKRALDKAGFVVSVGSACNTTSAKASHVLDAIRAPDVIKKGVIRISLCDNTTKVEIDGFVKAFVAAVGAQAGRSSAVKK